MKATVMGVMVFLILIMVSVSGVCAYMGVPLTWNRVDSIPGDYYEQHSIMDYYESRYGLAFLADDFFQFNEGWLNDPLYTDWADLGKPCLQEFLLQQQLQTATPSNVISMLWDTGAFFFGMLLFQVEGLAYIFNYVWWVMNLFVGLCSIMIARGVGS
jgi:hypothetical protein